MAYQISWYQKNRIAQIVVNDDYPIEEIQQACSEIANNYLSNGQKPIHLLMDISKMTKFPTTINQVKTSADLFLKHEALGWIVVIGKRNPLANFFVSIIIQMVGIDFRIVDSMEEAANILRRIDATLPA